jgi:hypothetical protein
MAETITYKYTIKDFEKYDKVVMVTPDGYEKVLTSGTGTTTYKRIGFYVYVKGKKSKTKWIDCKNDAKNSYSTISFISNGTVHSYSISTEKLISGEYTFKEIKSLATFDIANYTSDGKEYAFNYWSATDKGEAVTDDTIITKATTFYAVFKDVTKAVVISDPVIKIAFRDDGSDIYYKIFEGTAKVGDTIEDVIENNYQTVNFCKENNYGPDLKNFYLISESEYEEFKNSRGEHQNQVSLDYVINKDTYLCIINTTSGGGFYVNTNFIIDQKNDEINSNGINVKAGEKFLDKALGYTFNEDKNQTNLTNISGNTYSYTFDGTLYDNIDTKSILRNDYVVFYNRTIGVGMYTSGLSVSSLNQDSTNTKDSIDTFISNSDILKNSSSNSPVVFFALVNAKYAASLEGTVEDSKGTTWTVKCLNDTMYYAIGNSPLTEEYVNTGLKEVVNKVKELGAPVSSCKSFVNAKNKNTSYSLDCFSYEYGKRSPLGEGNLTITSLNGNHTLTLYSFFKNN